MLVLYVYGYLRKFNYNRMKTNYWVKKYKYKHFQKQLYRLKGVSNKNYCNSNNFSFLLKSLESVFFFSSQLESGRRVLRHFIKKLIKIHINIVCDKSITSKSSGIRMGKGKGNIKEWIHCLKVGVVLYSILNINYFQAKFLLKKAMKKFNFKTYCMQVFQTKSSVLFLNLFF